MELRDGNYELFKGLIVLRDFALQEGILNKIKSSKKTYDKN
jgi:hypothetical protein